MTFYKITSGINVEIQAESEEEAIRDYLIGLDNEAQHSIVNEFVESLKAEKLDHDCSE